MILFIGLLVPPEGGSGGMDMREIKVR